LFPVGIYSNFIAIQVLLRETTGQHTASRHCDWLWRYGEEVMDHPAYSPHLATSDFCLLGLLKMHWLASDLQ